MLSKLFVFITKCNKKFSPDLFGPKHVINRESFTNFKIIISKCDKNLLQSWAGIKNWDKICYYDVLLKILKLYKVCYYNLVLQRVTSSYNKVWQVLQILTIISKSEVIHVLLSSTGKMIPASWNVIRNIETNIFCDNW